MENKWQDWLGLVPGNCQLFTLLYFYLTSSKMCIWFIQSNPPFLHTLLCVRTHTHMLPRTLWTVLRHWSRSMRTLRSRWRLRRRRWMPWTTLHRSWWQLNTMTLLPLPTEEMECYKGVSHYSHYSHALFRLVLNFPFLQTALSLQSHAVNGDSMLCTQL